MFKKTLELVRLFNKVFLLCRKAHLIILNIIFLLLTFTGGSFLIFNLITSDVTLGSGIKEFLGTSKILSELA